MYDVHENGKGMHWVFDPNVLIHTKLGYIGIFDLRVRRKGVEIL
jgi:hypothetical protein